MKIQHHTAPPPIHSDGTYTQASVDVFLPVYLLPVERSRGLEQSPCGTTVWVSKTYWIPEIVVIKGQRIVTFYVEVFTEVRSCRPINYQAPIKVPFLPYTSGVSQACRYQLRTAMHHHP
jgi:hypothetical protein